MALTVDFEQMPDTRVAMLVNRTDKEQEFWFAGRPEVFKPGETRGVLVGIVDWLFRRDQVRCWTVPPDGCQEVFNGQCRAHGSPSTWAFRFGIKDGPEDLLTSLSPDAFETSPIVEARVLEGWETTAADRAGLTFKVGSVQVPKSDYLRQPGVVGHSMGAPAGVLRET